MSLIFHLDLDCFFVSAERLKNPRLIGKAVAVGGRGGRGVISSASYEARKFGVRSAMPTAQALRLCPNLILVSGSYSYYSELSKKVFAILGEFSPKVEARGIDEGYLDMTGSSSLFGSPTEAARRIRATVLEKTGLRCSIGIASNRLVAKIATDFCKPDGQYEVPAGKEAEFLAPMPIERIPGIGPATQKWLNGRGIFTVRELQRHSVESLEREAGSIGRFLYQAAWGKARDDGDDEPSSRSISRERTFEKDLYSEELLRKMMWKLSADLGQNLREDGVFAKAIRVKIRYGSFETVVRSKTLAQPSRLDQEIFDQAWRLLEDHRDRGKGIRLLGIACVICEQQGQLPLFGDVSGALKREEIENLKDELRKRFGSRALGTGRDLDA